jgi:hypothetical protein
MTHAGPVSPLGLTDLHTLDPRGGVLVTTTYWRPCLTDPDPEHPGEKASVLSYLPVDPPMPCPCGSGQHFAHCCQPFSYWRPVCPNPGLQGYSLLHPQSARFAPITVDQVTAFLDDAPPLYAIGSTFWTYWGDPAYDTEFGTICFGDLEVDPDPSLLVTALSDVRMEVLLAMLAPLELGPPTREFDTAAKHDPNVLAAAHERHSSMAARWSIAR